MEKGQIFNVLVDGEEKSAELLDIVEYEDERYAVYSVKNVESNYDLFVSKIKKDIEENEILTDIEDESVKEYILRIIHETLNR